MDGHTMPNFPTGLPNRHKERWREPTPDDPRRRIIRSEREMREVKLTFRVSQEEIDEFYRYARSHKSSMSYMIRHALVEVYPEIFKNANRYIRPPRPPAPVQDRTVYEQSFVDGTTTISADPAPFTK